MRGQKSAGAKNPSQDSAFGSMTDGEQSIASSSFRLSSFQSISSPIDEGVEDVGSSVLDLTASSSDSTCNSHAAIEPRADGPIARSTSDSAALQKGILESSTTTASSASALIQQPQQHHQQFLLPLEPPTIIVNGDQQNSGTFYTTSPSKQCNSVVGGTVEVFSQKYRVSSFEDMSLRRMPLKSVNKLAFRSLEEERRIESAFLPTTKILSSSPSLQQQHHLSQTQTHQDHRQHGNIASIAVNPLTAPVIDKIHDSKTAPSPTSPSQIRIYNNEKFKKLTHAAFSRKITSTKEQHTKWKNSILARKNVLIKSNESLLMDTASNGECEHTNGSLAPGVQWLPQPMPQMQQSDLSQQTAMPIYQNLTNRGMQKRIGSTNELCSRKQQKADIASVESTFGKGPRKSRSERQLLSLYGGLKQTSLNGDYDAVLCSAVSCRNSSSSGGFGAHRSDIVTFIDDSASSDVSTSEEFDDDDDDDYEKTDDNGHSSSSNSHRDMCQIIGGFVEVSERSSGTSGTGLVGAEENRPLLDGMEMSPISPVECSEML